ncbi:palmitoyltransferase ZDHHC22 [Bombina bombina]|uniref:palmitoyltransferase ZDHHC22 n=1 Tax=Bombina bombina TaxID=8345 RepID=UPI00235AB5AF|nr:palmitoyltransferase ZDHHC22 [Bombina bombina]
MLLKLLNLLAPFYFLCLLSVTFSLQIFLFLPGMCEDPSGILNLYGLLNSCLFLFLLVNVVGNYILVIWNSPGVGHIGTESEIDSKPFCHLCARVMSEQEHHCFFTGTCIGRSNWRSFVFFCMHTSCSCFHAVVSGVGYISEIISLSFFDPLTFLKLLPHSITRFFSGSILSSDMLVVLMIYVWFGVGLACAAFCCHQLMLISKGPSCFQNPQINTAAKRSVNLHNVFGDRWILGILVPQPRDP